MSPADLFGAEAAPARRSPLGRGQSAYDRHAFDAYFTEPWVTGALVDAVALRGRVWEPAAGRGDMAAILASAGGCEVIASDLADHGRPPAMPAGAELCNIETGVDFLAAEAPPAGVEAIVTNPPYGELAQRFVDRALALTEPVGGQVAMLLRVDWDCVGSRRPLFAEHSAFARKLVLTRRPRWDWWQRARPTASPRESFAWYIWDWTRGGPPRLEYGP